MKEVVIKFLETNPNVGIILLSSFLLPITLLIINNRQNQKSKEKDHSFELEKEKYNKDLELKYESKSEQWQHEKTVHSSLIKILFEVQNLHIALSGSCVDYDCIIKAVERFRNSFTKYQDNISDNQMYLTSKVTNHLYKFYQILGNLLTELKDIQNEKKYELAIVSVFFHSQILAGIVIKIQEHFVKDREELKKEFSKTDMGNFIKCCGDSPSPELTEQYKKHIGQATDIQESINNFFAFEDETLEDEENDNSKQSNNEEYKN